MEFECIDIRETLPSGGSVKVTIPMKIVKETWRKVEEKLSEGKPGGLLTTIEKFSVCFIRSDGKVILELPENVIKGKEYPDELVSEVQEYFARYQAKNLFKRTEGALRSLARGRISKTEFESEVNRISEYLKDISRRYARAFSERELHFIALGELEQLLMVLSIEEKRGKDEDFLWLLGETKNVRDDLDDLKDLLETIEEGFSKGRIDRRYYNVLKQKYLGMLELAERRLNELKEIVCRPKYEIEY